MALSDKFLIQFFPLRFHYILLDSTIAQGPENKNILLAMGENPEWAVKESFLLRESQAGAKGGGRNGL